MNKICVKNFFGFRLWCHKVWILKAVRYGVDFEIINNDDDDNDDDNNGDDDDIIQSIEVVSKGLIIIIIYFPLNVSDQPT